MWQCLRKGVLLGQWPSSPPRWRALATVCLDTQIHKEARSATITFADAWSSLQTSLIFFFQDFLWSHTCVHDQFVLEQICLFVLCNDALNCSSGDFEPLRNGSVALALVMSLHNLWSEFRTDFISLRHCKIVILLTHSNFLFLRVLLTVEWS